MNFLKKSCDHSYPSFAKPIDTSHRVVCYGTLSAGKQAGRGKLHWDAELQHSVQPLAHPDGQVGEEGQQQHHQGRLHHVLGCQKRQVDGGPTFYEV